MMTPFDLEAGVIGQIQHLGKILCGDLPYSTPLWFFLLFWVENITIILNLFSNFDEILNVRSI